MDAADQKLIAEFEELTRSLEDLLRTLATDLGSENFESSETKETSFIDLINFSTLPSDQKKVCHRARKLRNFYAHKNGNKLAVPDGSLVRSLRLLVERLTHIPTLATINWRTEFVWVTPESHFGEAVSKLVHGDFDQLPVLCDSKAVGYFTTTSVAKSVHDGLDIGGAVVEATTVASVERHWDPVGNSIIDRTTALPIVIRRLFDLSRGRTEVLLVKSGSRYCGILTPFDIGALSDCLANHISSVA